MKLTCHQLTKKFADKLAVQNFTAEFTEGVYGLLGPNGSGKTTLLRMLADILKPTSGEILFNQRNIATMGSDYRDIIGYLPQEFGVYRNFTAERFLKYFASLKGLDKGIVKEKIDEVLDIVNLQENRKRKIGTFSGGMKRRLGIAQALLNDPKILIVDEPTAGLDPQERVRFRNLLSQIAQDKIVILSTHIVGDIEYIAKEIILMKQGSIVRQSTLEELLHELQGKVWEVVISPEQLPQIQERYSIGNLQRTDKGIEVRIVHESKPLEQAQVVQPTLEDVSMYFFEEDAVKSV